jgi:hypothetical protein
MQKHRRGYALISYRDSDRKYEADTLTCCHCQRVIFLHTADTIAKDNPGYCPTCHAATCHACAIKGGCQPFEAKVDNSERRGAERDRLFREMGLVSLLVAFVLSACGYAPPIGTTALCDHDAPPVDAAPLDLVTPWTRHTIYNGLSGADGVNLATIDGKLAITSPWEQSAKTTVSTLDGGTWSTVSFTISAPEDAVFADVDNDGHLDVISAGDASKRVYVTFGPSWTPTIEIAAATNVQNWTQVAFADINGDGTKDIVAGGRVGAGAAVGYFTSATPRTAGSYTWHSIGPSGVVWSLVPRDVDGDGDMDIIVSDGAAIGLDNSLMGSRWLEQLSSGAWANHTIYNYKGADQLARFLHAEAGRVIDGSSRDTGISLLNIRTTSDWIAWSATSVPWPDDAGHYLAVRPSDIDGDGIEDLVVSMHHADTDYTTDPEDLSGVLWLRGPTWERGEISGVAGVKFDNLELYDVDGDGDLDVVTTEQGIAGITPAGQKLGLVWYENPRGP